MDTSERQKTIRMVVIYSVLVTAVAYIAPYLGGTPAAPGLGFLVWGIAPTLVSLFLRALTGDWRDLGVKPAFGRNARWYALSVFIYPTIMVLTVLIGQTLSVSSLTNFSLMQYLQMVLAALPIFFVFAIFEEVGWRGYLAPKLASLGINSYFAAALVAVVWATWHLPYFRELMWDFSSESPTTFIPRFYLVSFAFSVVYGEIRQLSGTFWPAVIMHAITNATGHPLAADYLSLSDNREFLGSIGNGFITITLFVLVGIALNHWRTGHAEFKLERISE